MSLNGALIYMALCCPQPAFFDSSVSHCRHSESNRNINFAIVPCLSFRVILFCLIIFVSFRLSFHPYLNPPPPKKNLMSHEALFTALYITCSVQKQTNKQKPTPFTFNSIFWRKKSIFRRVTPHPPASQRATLGGSNRENRQIL